MLIRHPLALAVLSCSLASAANAQTTVRVGPSDDVEAAINALGPGDELILSGGQYELDERFSFAIAGTEEAPIVIRAADGERPHLHRASADENIVDIDNAEYVVLRGIEFSGGSAGVRISGARHLTIEQCEIHDTGDVALRANDNGATYESLRILHNHIHHTNYTGEGMYLGCNNDDCRIANSLIEGNYIHHTNQATVEQGDGIEIKEGSYGNIVRDNVIHDTNYPCIITYSTVGNGPPNVIERNVMWHCGDHGIQSAADAVIRNNIILGANYDGIAMQPHQSGQPANMTVVNNTVLNAEGDAISVRGLAGSVVIANNAVYTQDGNAIFIGGGDTSALVLAGNVGVGGLSGADSGFTAGNLAADFASASYDGGPPIDVFPANGGALVGAGDPSYAPDDDFNGTPRGTTVDVGAYVFDPSGNPGWTLTEAFKDETSSPTGGDDAGPQGDAGPPGDAGPQDDASSPGPDDDASDTPDQPGTPDSGEGPGGNPTTPSGHAGDDSGGCSCRTVGGAPPLALFVLLAPLWRRRRAPFGRT